MTKSELLEAMKDAPGDADVELEFLAGQRGIAPDTSDEDAVRAVVVGQNKPDGRHWVLISNVKTD